MTPQQQAQADSMTEVEAVVTTSVDDGVLVVSINRPRARNCVNRAVAQAVGAALERLDDEDGLHVGVITGVGPVFCAGMDLKAFARGELPVAGDRGFAGITTRSAQKPLIAAVEGFAVGGGLEIALACDLIVAARDAKFGLPEVRVGLIAGAGGLWRLPRRIGVGNSTLMALTGTPITGVEAHRIGLVDRLVAPGEALAEGLILARAIGANAPLALAASKAILTEGFTKSAAEFWDWQRDHMKAVIRSADAREGANAFAEKRPPRWLGR
jgi:enoyl-CoA hydratase